jgi:hypothetical protein
VTFDVKTLVLRNNSVQLRSLTDPRDKPSAQPLYIDRCPTGAVAIGGFEPLLGMNLVQIGTNEFFPYLNRLAANERHLHFR